MPAAGLRVSRLEHGATYLVLSFPLPGPALDAFALSEAEKAVARALLAGRSNVEIAAERRTSVRTVANQVQSIFRKVGVMSRAEFAAKVTGAAEAEPDER